MNEYVIAPELAEEELKKMEDEFGAVSTMDRRAVLLDAIKRGLVDFNPEIPAITYHLQKPVMMDKGEKLEKITLHEPCFAEIERIDKGTEYKVDEKGGFIFSKSIDHNNFARLLVVLGGITTGTVDKLMRGDVAVLQAISDFFK